MEISSDSELDKTPSDTKQEAPNASVIANQIASILEYEVEESSDEEVENEEVDKTVKEAAEVADWVEGVLDDAAPKTPQELEGLARAGLQKAHKDHDYRSEVMFAGLVNLYCWMPRLGRLRLAMQVA